MSSETLRPKRRRSAHSNLAAHGEPWVWLTGGALALAIAMITGLLLFITVRGAATFWPQPLVLLETADGRRVLGEVSDREPAGEAGRLGVGSCERPITSSRATITSGSTTRRSRARAP